VIGEYDEFEDESDSNDVMNEREHTKDVGYRRLVGQVEQKIIFMDKNFKIILPNAFFFIHA